MIPVQVLQLGSSSLRECSDVCGRISVAAARAGADQGELKGDGAQTGLQIWQNSRLMTLTGLVGRQGMKLMELPVRSWVCGLAQTLLWRHLIPRDAFQAVWGGQGDRFSFCDGDGQSWGKGELIPCGGELWGKGSSTPGAGELIPCPGQPWGKGELHSLHVERLLSDFLLGLGYVGSLWLLLWMPLP